MAKLYVVATPIGNMADISLRALETLSQVAFIAAEDTRITGNLLRRHNIRTRLTALHQHNEKSMSEEIVRRMLTEDIDVALTSDAGTPAISDPGGILVHKAAESGIEVLAVAGPSAVSAALSVCGFDAREFAFYGFLPRVKSDRIKKLHKIAGGPSVAVLYESPKRILSLMESIVETLPGCVACVCCDLTKLYERSIRGAAFTLLEMLQNNPMTGKGEYCVVLDLHAVVIPEPQSVSVSIDAVLVTLMLEGMCLEDAVHAAVQQGVRKNIAKKAAIRIQEWIRREYTP